MTFDKTHEYVTAEKSLLCICVFFFTLLAVTHVILWLIVEKNLLASLGHMLVFWKGNINRTVSALRSIVYHYNGAQWYEQFLQVN